MRPTAVSLNSFRHSRSITVALLAALVLVSTALNSNPATQLDPHKIVVSTEVPASNGQVVTTANVVFSDFTLTNPAGVTAISECTISAHDRNQPSNSWLVLDASSPSPQARVTPTPGKSRVTFTW